MDGRKGEKSGRPIQGRIATRRIILVVTMAAGWMACGSVTAYLRGLAPPAALPDPEVRVSVRERTEDGVFSAGRVVFESSGPHLRGGGSFEITGRVARWARGFAPRWGFRVAIETADREAILDAALFHEMPEPDFQTGDTVTLEARPTGEGLVVVIRDKAGLWFLLSAGGASIALTEGVEATITSREAYWEVRSGEDLCLRADAHRSARVRVGGESPRLDPGESRVLCDHDGACWLAVVADARETEERQCADAEPAHQVVFFARVSPATMAGR